VPWQAFIKDKGYPKSTPVTRLSEGAETSIFIQQFEVWPQPQASPNYTAKRGSVAKVESKQVDYKAMYGLKKEAQSVVDDGSGKLDVRTHTRVLTHLVPAPGGKLTHAPLSVCACVGVPCGGL
jgi:hypothetical protein